MNRLRLIVTLCVLAAFSWQPANTDADEQKRPSEKRYAAEIKELQQERIAALKAAAEHTLIRYREGHVDFRSVILAQADLVEARLDAADRPEERVSLLEEQLELAETTMKYTKQRFDIGATINVDVLQARASVLDIKIKLLRERAKLEPTAE